MHDCEKNNQQGAMKPLNTSTVKHIQLHKAIKQR